MECAAFHFLNNYVWKHIISYSRMKMSRIVRLKQWKNGWVEHKESFSHMNLHMSPDPKFIENLRESLWWRRLFRVLDTCIANTRYWPNIDIVAIHDIDQTLVRISFVQRIWPHSIDKCSLPCRRVLCWSLKLLDLPRATLDLP